MSWIKSVLRELVGLVVDDIGFAASVIVWIAVVTVLSSYVAAKSGLLPLALAAGLGAILLQAVLRRAGQGR